MLISKAFPLHTSCEVFSSVDPQAKNETDDDYVTRCEQEVTKYFTQVPSALEAKSKNLPKNQQPKLFGPYLTCATDEKMFVGIIGKICGVLLAKMEGAIATMF
jgi:hypothetical protein